ncbi:MAG: hypothetical protein WCK53_13590, partial [Methanomicrobiales archaeon]
MNRKIHVRFLEGGNWVTSSSYSTSAFYSADSVSTLGQHCFWISRVPETIKEAQKIVNSNSDWSLCTDTRYKCAIYESSYGDVKQRWVLFESSEQKKKSILTYEKNLNPKFKKDKTALNKIGVKGFACEADARM